MNILGYLITFANFQNFTREGKGIENSSIHISTLESLLNHIESMPEFPLEGFRRDCVNRGKDTSLFVSKNLREYIMSGRGDPEEEGVLIQVYYKKLPANSPPQDIVLYFLHKEDVDAETKKKLVNYVARTIKDRSKRNEKLIDDLDIY